MGKTNDKIFDELLVLQFQTGRQKAFGILVNRWHKRLVYYSYKLTGDKEASKDIVQDCWIAIYTNLFNLKDPSALGAWMLTIVSNKSVDWLKKQIKERKKIDEFKQNQEGDNLKNKRDNTLDLELKKAIEKLSKKQRIVLNLFYLDKFTTREIGSILNLKIGTIKSRLFNAREKLKKSIIKNKQS
jgi:RNA polymerase sigma-70 factor (ECF subfamily)